MSEKSCNVEVFSRVTGFFRPVQSWNKGKTEEFTDRKRFIISEEVCIEKNDISRTTESVWRTGSPPVITTPSSISLR